MTDRELLELAAKAAGIKLEWWDAGCPGYFTQKTGGLAFTNWNPLTDDGDALRLAVKLRLHVDHHRSGVSVWVMTWVSGAGKAECYSEDTGDDIADTRRAIVRAAAAIGEKK